MLIYCPLVTSWNLPIQIGELQEICVCVLSPKTVGLFYLTIPFLGTNILGCLLHPCRRMTHHLSFLQELREMREEFLIFQRNKINITQPLILCMKFQVWSSAQTNIDCHLTWKPDLWLKYFWNYEKFASSEGTMQSSSSCFRAHMSGTGRVKV